DPRGCPPPADYRPPCRRLLLRRRQGPRPGAAAGRPLPRRRDRRRALSLTPGVPRRGQSRLRADGGPGRDPQRHRVHLGAWAAMAKGDAKAVRATVRGGVQAVGFREATVRRAGELGVLGWVRNGEDDEVLVHADAPTAAVDRLLEFLGEGPP